MWFFESRQQEPAVETIVVERQPVIKVPNDKFLGVNDIGALIEKDFADVDK